ncbi:AAA family ATPase [Candidatus Gracilibacteria bacterium]|nr:AAA family ATPase [Candidatus Gracilibacteria bacterium]NJM87292.1 AAA family ATPase [Hydrococcus sp. RU_2_2]NJP20024.1 AAA family ATPase [Hydrococcus sp. CRU_1_1]
MVRIVIFGKSGSGKTTLAKALASLHRAKHLDLDAIAWKSNQPGVRAAFEESKRELLEFIKRSDSWVIEGCYTYLLREAIIYCTEAIFLNPGVETCIENCKARPWEPHKYPHLEAQNKNLPMLIAWVREYENRNDEFSLREHRQLFEDCIGKKVEYNSNLEVYNRVNSSYSE